MYNENHPSCLTIDLYIFPTCTQTILLFDTCAVIPLSMEAIGVYFSSRLWDILMSSLERGLKAFVLSQNLGDLLRLAFFSLASPSHSTVSHALIPPCTPSPLVTCEARHTHRAAPMIRSTSAGSVQTLLPGVCSSYFRMD